MGWNFRGTALELPHFLINSTSLRMRCIQCACASEAVSIYVPPRKTGAGALSPLGMLHERLEKVRERVKWRDAQDETGKRGVEKTRRLPPVPTIYDCI